MDIPGDKRYFRIGEVSRIVGVEPYVLRYWESVFPQIRPVRADSNQRTYQRKDLDLIIEIKRLLYDQRLTIEGARQRLRQGLLTDTSEHLELIAVVKSELRGILELLD